MSKETRPDYTYKWGSTGTVSTPTNGKIQQGWVVEKPTFAYWNFIENRQDQALAYIMQQGIPEWSNAIEYQNGSSWVQYGGVLYYAIQTGTNHQPDTSPTYWTEFTGSGGIDLSASPIALLEPTRYLAVKPTTANEVGIFTVIPNDTSASSSLICANDRLDYTNYSQIFMGIDAGGASLQTQGHGSVAAKNLTISANSHTSFYAKTDGTNGINTSSPTCKLDIDSDKIRLRTAKTPSSASDTGNAGDICWDSNYVYICVATNTWKRSAIATW